MRKFVTIAVGYVLAVVLAWVLTDTGEPVKSPYELTCLRCVKV